MKHPTHRINKSRTLEIFYRNQSGTLYSTFQTKYVQLICRVQTSLSATSMQNSMPSVIMQSTWIKKTKYLMKNLHEKQLYHRKL